MDASKDKLFDKIRKLYRLSQDPVNEHEAALAADRVRQLLEDHNLSLGDALNEKSKSTQEAAFVGRIPRYFAELARACAELYDVEYFTFRKPRGIYLRDIRNEVVFCGLPENVATAVLGFEYFRVSISRLLIRSARVLVRKKGRPKKSRRRKNDYRNGAALRILHEVRLLKAKATEASPQSAALVHVGCAVARAHCDALGLKRVPIKKPRLNLAFQMGYTDAGEIQLRPATEIPQ